MTRLLLSEREKNARITCSHCFNCNDTGWCRLPILIEYEAGTIRVARLISFSDDGLTCQLFRDKEGKE